MSSYTTATTTVTQGTIVRFYTSQPFTNLSGVVADPTEVVFAFQVAGGVVRQATYGTSQAWGTIVRDSTGSYHIDIDTTSFGPGIYQYVWAGAGTVQCRAEGQVEVVEPQVPLTF